MKKSLKVTIPAPKKVSNTTLSLEEQQIEEEFEKMRLSISNNHFSEEAIAPENYAKNRYLDVLPNETTRVKLSMEESVPGSDYINANYVTAPDFRSQLYICCQAPLPNTFGTENHHPLTKRTTGDFWKMVWEKRCPVVVMLTRLEEKSRVKADIYWPGEEGATETYGKIKVTHKKTWTRSENIILRSFQMTHEEQHRELIQLHYTEWPDFGIPKSPAVMKDLITELDIRKKGLDEPIVVHCSAGIGRTGTFLAIHMALQKAATANEPIDVMKMVLDLRDQRHGMVQSKDQYKFVYATIKDMLEDKYSKRSKHKVLYTNQVFNQYQELKDYVKNRPTRSTSQPSVSLNKLSSKIEKEEREHITSRPSSKSASINYGHLNPVQIESTLLSQSNEDNENNCNGGNNESYNEGYNESYNEGYNNYDDHSEGVEYDGEEEGVADECSET